MHGRSSEFDEEKLAEFVNVLTRVRVFPVKLNADSDAHWDAYREWMENLNDALVVRSSTGDNRTGNGATGDVDD